jgi:hypothetical protein
MSYHIVDFLAQSSGALFQQERYIHSIESAFGREPLPPDAVVAGPLKRPNEIDFKEGFELIEFLIVFSSQLFVRDRVPFDIPTAEVDIVDVESPTGRARMCCRPKPTDGRRRATRESGGPEPLSIGPVAHTRHEVKICWTCHLTYTWSGRCLMCFS